MSLSIKVSVKIPAKLFSDANVQHALHQKQRTVTGPEVKRDFDGTVDGWQLKPSFTTRYSMNDREVGVKVYPTGNALEIYSLVVSGSPKHPIPRGFGFT